jgi:hypothetical protein
MKFSDLVDTGKTVKLVEVSYGDASDDLRQEAWAATDKRHTVWQTPTGAKRIMVGGYLYKVFSGYMGRNTIRLNNPYQDPATNSPVFFPDHTRDHRDAEASLKRTYENALEKISTHLTPEEINVLGLDRYLGL